MPKWRFWEKPAEPEQQSALPGRTATAGEPVIPPTQPRPSAPVSPDRIATLKRRREGVLFDVEQSELANQPENPWRERVELLNATIADIRAERSRLDNLPKIERHSPPDQPVTVNEVTWEDPARVVFAIGATSFVFESELDWAERGTYVTHGDLELRSGDPAALAPIDWEEEERAAFTRQLGESLFIFASDLRNRAERGEPVPDPIALSDLISVCETCGDWQLWGGFCPTCAARDRLRRDLDNEVSDRLAEISNEEEERAKIAERLPIALRRLADVEAELKSLGITG